MKENNFLRWIGAGAFVFSVWLFFPFLKSFFVALLLAMASYPLQQSLQLRIQRYKYGEEIAPIMSAAVVTLGLSVVIFLPIALLLYYVLNNPANFVDEIRRVGDIIDTLGMQLPSYLTWLKEPIEDLIMQVKLHKNEIVTFLAGWLQSGLALFLVMIAEMTMIIIFFFFLLWYGRRLTLFSLPIVPLARSIKREFLNEITKTTAVVFYTLVGVMIAQGLAFGVFITFFEGYNPILLGFLTGFSAIIPIFGTALVWVPVAAHEYLQGHIFNAFIITLYSWAMLAFFIDNIVKLMILNFVNRTIGNKKTRINDFVIFFAIVGGLATFGFWGIILGPAIVAFSVTTLRALRKTNRVMLH